MTMYGQRCTVFETQGPSTALPIHFVNPQAPLRMTMYGQRCIVLGTQGPSTALQIHFVNPQGSAQDDNVRTKVHRFGNTRSFDCAADSLREPAGLRSG